jgi:hypothetical protein
MMMVLTSIHPLRVEPVAWVSGRGDVLSGMFTSALVIGISDSDGVFRCATNQRS